ncbi:MAG: cytochrome b N-terminal domain-containing protein, partial [Sphingomonadaceae bacterium]|nr:cytochrome b N-terminal domain-containing protein [Sphingomonadaceae bacterium]
YGSYKAPREILWLLGVIIFLLMMATAFMGYVLPWGQMSFWGATVITNLFSAIPIVGTTVQQWLLGGFAPDNAALNRFFSLHYLLPFVIAAVIVLHIWALHIPGSNNPTGVEVQGPQDTVPFHPYYTAKDGFGLGIFLLIFALLAFFAPNALGHPVNYVPANPISTPSDIVPEWYFWPYYAILRSFTIDLTFFGFFTIVPAKLLGVTAMFGSILLLFFLPWLDRSPVRSGNYRPMFKWFFWALVVDVLILGYCGGSRAEEPYLMISQLATAYYFAHFLIILPALSMIERPLPLPHSISESVLHGEKAESAPIGLGRDPVPAE